MPRTSLSIETTIHPVVGPHCWRARHRDGESGGLEENAQVIDHLPLASKTSHWSAREEWIHGLRILPRREVNEEKQQRSAAAVRELTAEVALVLRAVAVAVTADASAASAAQGQLRRQNMLDGYAAGENLTARRHVR